jgi:hypothetical protein
LCLSQWTVLKLRLARLGCTRLDLNQIRRFSDSDINAIPSGSPLLSLSVLEKEYGIHIFQTGEKLAKIASDYLRDSSRVTDLKQSDGSEITVGEEQNLVAGDKIYYPKADASRPSVELEVSRKVSKKTPSTIVSLPTGKYIVEGEQSTAIVGKVIKKGNSGVTVGNEDILKVETFLEGVSVKFDKERSASVEFGGEIAEISLRINGNVFTGILKGDTNFKFVKPSFFSDQEDIEASTKVEFDGRYHRELQGDSWKKIADFVGILIFSEENQETAYSVFLEKNPDVQTWINDTARSFGYVAGGVALVAAAALAVWVVLNNVTGFGVLDDVAGFAVVTGLVRFALQRFAG